jgi:serine phosphatase RsbU (regulator of sigma subunit)
LENEVILDSSEVSRTHARIFQDPFGRWIVEDLNSHNGVFIEGQRISKAKAFLPGEKISIGIYTLSLCQETTKQTEAEGVVGPTLSPVEEGLTEEVILQSTSADHPLIKQLNEITSYLLDLSKSTEVYPTACQKLAVMLDALVTVVRLPCNAEVLPDNLEVLACYYGPNCSDSPGTISGNVPLSRRILNAVRVEGAAIMGKSTPSTGHYLTLTVVDENCPHIVFSAPLTDLDEIVDVLYVDIPEDRAPSDLYEFLQAITRQINFASKSLLLSEARAQRQILDQQLSLARDIQSKLTPDSLDAIRNVDIALVYEPAMWVGGDYCDIWSMEDGSVIFAIGDVSGKGLPAAMIMSNLHAALRTTMMFCTDLALVVQHVNRHLAQNLSQGRFVTFFLGKFDPVKSELTYVNAGHIPPLVFNFSSIAVPLDQRCENIPLGILEDFSFKSEVTIISPDNGLVIVTDGVTEAKSPGNEMFEFDRLTKLIMSLEDISAQSVVQAIKQKVINFCETIAQKDDVTIFALINRNLPNNNT